MNEISAISDYRATLEKEYYSLERRMKLLTPMFEEIRDSKEALPRDLWKALDALKSALGSAIKILRFGSEASKIYIVIEREQILKRFQDVTFELEHALSAIPHNRPGISDELKEQVAFVLAQFRRAKGRIECPDAEIYEDLLTLYNKPNSSTRDPDILRRLLEKLQVTQISELNQESLALHKMAPASRRSSDDNTEKMPMTLKKTKDFLLTEISEVDSVNEHSGTSSCSAQTSTAEGNLRAPVIPYVFCCPICHELMKDPVILSTGQTFDRCCIRKWLESGHLTCPVTRQALVNTALVPNGVLRGLIAEWCEANQT